MSRLSYLLFALALVACKKKDPPTTEGGSATPPGVKGKRSSLGASQPAGEFTPTTRGFKFQNYGNEDGIENLTVVEIERLFGPAVCADRDGETCILTPAAERWMENENKGMDGGHCEGMATVALLFQLGKLDPAKFGGKTAFELEIANNKTLQHEIAYWFVTQSLQPFQQASTVRMTPNEVVDKLVGAFTSNKESYTLGFYLATGGGGHATTPYAVEDQGNDITWILHYDNNNPGQERHIEVDRKKNTWTYFTAANPKEPGETYNGDATTKTLMLSPTSVRLGKLDCAFCGDIDGDQDATRGSRQITTEGHGQLLITDDAGKKIGHSGGKVVNEIAGADVVERKSGRFSDQEPIYKLPGGHKLTMTLDGAALKGKETTDVTLFGPGYTMGVYDVELSPKEKDTIEVSSDWSEISYKTDLDATPILELGISTKAADYEFEVSAGGETGGQRVGIKLDVKTGTIAIEASAKDGNATYEVEVRRIDNHKTQVFKHKGVSSGAKDRLVLHYAEWKGNGQPMKGDLDKGEDGTIDDIEQLTDEE